jgi:putative IMPACT (imprinted ancient) family translation regulator
MIDPKEVSQAVSLMLNTMDTKNAKEFIKAMGKEHRTLQQRFTQLCFNWLTHCDSLNQTNKFDDRNKASVEISKKVYDFLEKEELSFNRKHILPFI